MRISIQINMPFYTQKSASAQKVLSYSEKREPCSLTDCLAPSAVLSTRILEVKVMNSWAVPRWKKLMDDRSWPA